MRSVVFFDLEIGVEDKIIKDIGAADNDGRQIHSSKVNDLMSFMSSADYICGHNIIHHDLKYLKSYFNESDIPQAIDTLHISPLLFPQKPYHKLLKDDKLQVEELNNPLNDSLKAKRLFYDEVNAYNALNDNMKIIFSKLLRNTLEFKAFFNYVGMPVSFFSVEHYIRKEFKGEICDNAGIESIIANHPVELAYALALISTNDRYSVTPRWLLHNYPIIENIIKILCNTPCNGCLYCNKAHDVHSKLRKFFGYDRFRTYNGEPLQEEAVKAAVSGKSLLAVFPTGGGKSLTFQLPALMAGEATHGLTVVISPLQSLMKDQVDNLNARGIVDAVTINGLLSPIERSEAIGRVANGMASLLYISPEQLRSNTVERLLLSRNIVRFVIDEAHCFSAWGHDFRVDYFYIGDFIRKLQEKKRLPELIPVSCFTATAKQKVISDIREYFSNKLSINLELFATDSTRKNLHYVVLYKESEEDKYDALRMLIERKNCPTIVYVSRTRKSREIAERLCSDGFPALPFNGKMDSTDKIINQEAFIQNKVKVMVATSAFGMGVDKPDVGLVVHYDISDSLENYVQESGRAGRDQSINAECFVLFNDNDLDKHFILLNQTKLSFSEIQQVWKAIKDMTRMRRRICCSALEIARQAGWDDSVKDIETRVKTAVAALENAGYIRRGNNVPHIYATSIKVRNMDEAASKIDGAQFIDEASKSNCKRIVKSLISARSIAQAVDDDAESRVDYLADILGIEKNDVIYCINMMRQEGILSDSMDMSAHLLYSENENRAMSQLENYAKLEDFLLSRITEDGFQMPLKHLNEDAHDNNITFSSVRNIRTILYYLTIKGFIKKHDVASGDTSGGQRVGIYPTAESGKMHEKFLKRIDICRFIVKELYKKSRLSTHKDENFVLVNFSMLELLETYRKQMTIGFTSSGTTQADIEDALLYLSKIGAMKLEGGFLVLYNGLEINRLVTDNKIRYKMDDYKSMGQFYQQRIQQIHIVGEYAHLMVKDYPSALQYVQDYFQMDFKKFIAKYFKAERARQIERNITPAKYDQLFGGLSAKQLQIINDAESRHIVVAAGPGSGKTKVLVHKLASLLLMEDVKHEQLLMLTFSRAAATEFKKILIGLIGNAANFVEIKTFHSYCFDLLGKIGSLENAGDVVKDATSLILSNGAEMNRISKKVLVIDEAQDMDADEFSLVQALMKVNDDMRVIAVGDDDQNIYEFRGADSKYLRQMVTRHDAVLYEMNDNYRSLPNIVNISNSVASLIKTRMKSRPIRSVHKENGKVIITMHACPNFEQAIVNQIIDNGETGKTCVLTNTNEDALNLVGLLVDRGIRAKLIQTFDSFSIYDIAEIRFLMKCIDKELQSPVISDYIWENAKDKLSRKYAGSDCLELCLNLIRDFEETNPSVKYRTDLEEFIKESKLEDFYHDDKNVIYVSTIHKSKGREFDTVYVMLKNYDISDDSGIRCLYVGMTRAKSSLYIHCDNDIFSEIHSDSVEIAKDTDIYEEPGKVTFHLTHRDVFLGYFKGMKGAILKLQSGNPLHPANNFLCADIDGREIPVVKFSRAFEGKIQNYRDKGFEMSSAAVRFVVAWRDKEDENETETAIILPVVTMEKKHYLS